MQANTTPTAAAGAATPQVVTPPPVAPAPPPMMMGGGAMMPPPQTPMMAGGGYAPMPMANGGMTTNGKQNPIKNFFGDINLVEAGILALGVATFLYAIHYYRFQIAMAKTTTADLNARVQKLEASESARQAKESNANAVGRMRSRKRIVL